MNIKNKVTRNLIEISKKITNFRLDKSFNELQKEKDAIQEGIKNLNYILSFEGSNYKDLEDDIKDMIKKLEDKARGLDEFIEEFNEDYDTNYKLK